MFESPEQTLSALNRVGYFTDCKTATTVYLAGNINKPIMLEGPAGAGKTELAQSVARAASADLVRLQCYQGINEEKAIGHFDKGLQELFVLLKTKSAGTCDWAQIRQEITSRAFFLAGPLLTAIEREKRCVLLTKLFIFKQKPRPTRRGLSFARNQTIQHPVNDRPRR